METKSGFCKRERGVAVIYPATAGQCVPAHVLIAVKT